MHSNWIVAFEDINTRKIKKDYIKIKLKLSGKSVYYYINKEWVGNLEENLTFEQKEEIMKLNPKLKPNVKFTMLEKSGRRTRKRHNRRRHNRKKRRSGTRSKITRDLAGGKVSFYNILVVIIAMILTMNLFNTNSGNSKKDIENLNRVFNDELNKAFGMNSSLAIQNNSTLELGPSSFDIVEIQNERINETPIISEIKDTPLLSKLMAAISSSAVMELMRTNSQADFLFDVICYNIGGNIEVVQGDTLRRSVLGKGLPIPIDQNILKGLAKEIKESIDQIYGPDKLGVNSYVRMSTRIIKPINTFGLADGEHIDIFGSLQAEKIGLNESLVKHPELYNMLSTNPALRAQIYGWDGPATDLNNIHPENIVGIKYVDLENNENEGEGFIGRLLRLALTTASDKKMFLQRDPTSTVFAEQIASNDDGKAMAVTSHFSAPTATKLHINNGKRTETKESSSFHRLLIRFSGGPISDKVQNSGKQK